MQTLLSLFIDHLLQLVTNQGLFAEVIAAHRERSIAQILAAANDYHEGLAAAGGSGFSIRPLQDAIRLSRFAHTPGEAAFTFNAALCYVNRRNIVWTVELQQKISSSAATLQAILLSFQVYRDEECVKSLSGMKLGDVWDGMSTCSSASIHCSRMRTCRPSSPKNKSSTWQISE
jgi:hypothetical protein